MQISYSSGAALTTLVLLCLSFVNVHAETPASVYAEFCSVCHGDKGDGRSHAVQGLLPPPRDFTDPAATELLSRENIIEIITHGKPGTAMSAWNSQLDTNQIAALADYIRSEFVPSPDQASEIAANELPATEASLNRGKEIYDSTCSVCHGDDGAGAIWGRTSLKPAPVNFTLVDPMAQMKRSRMLASVTNGRPGTAMSAFSSQLSEFEIADVVDYIRESFMQAAGQDTAMPDTAAPAPAASTVGMAVLHGMPARRFAPAEGITNLDSDAILPHGLKGDPVTGMALYMSSCTACHGDKGNGEGPRAYFIFPRPRNFLATENRERLNRPLLFNAIGSGVPGREMPAWNKVLTDQQIADITEYVFQAFIIGNTGTPVSQADND